MGKKTPRYIVLNKKSGGRYHKFVSSSDNLMLLQEHYVGDSYEIIQTADLEERKDTPTVEMTKVEKDLFMGQMKVIEEEGKHVNNFEYFVNALTFSNELHDHALDRLLDEYETDSKQLMSAWLNPKLIKAVD